MKRNAIGYALICLVIAMTGKVSAQITLGGTNYTQTFDAISLGLPSGWSVRTNATTTSSGVEVTLTTSATSWGSASGQFANYASTVNNGTNLLGSESTTVQAGCTNRSLGMRQTGAFGDPGAAFVLHLQNTLGHANLRLVVDLNLLSSQGRTNSWVIDYGIGGNPASFTSVLTNADQGVFGAVTRTVAFGSVLDNQAQNVWIRIVALEATTGSGSRDTFGIDNFKLNYESSSAVSPIPLNLQLIGTNAVLTWTNASFVPQAAPEITGPFTSLPGATSPYTNPIGGPQKYFRLKAN